MTKASIDCSKMPQNQKNRQINNKKKTNKKNPHTCVCVCVDPATGIAAIAATGSKAERWLIQLIKEVYILLVLLVYDL